MCARARRYHPRTLAGHTHKHNRLEDTGLFLLRDQADVDVGRDLEVIPFRLVHRLGVRDEADDGADLRSNKVAVSA